MPKPPVRRHLQEEKEGDVVKSTVGQIDSSKVIADLRTKSANHEWLDRHRDELRQKFANKYVAVHRGAVVASDPEFPRMLSHLRKRLENTDPSLAAIEFMSEEEFIWVL